jgi:hypothetical protein
MSYTNLLPSFFIPLIIHNNAAKRLLTSYYKINRVLEVLFDFEPIFFAYYVAQDYEYVASAPSCCAAVTRTAFQKSLRLKNNDDRSTSSTIVLLVVATRPFFFLLNARTGLVGSDRRFRERLPAAVSSLQSFGYEEMPSWLVQCSLI